MSDTNTTSSEWGVFELFWFSFCAIVASLIFQRACGDVWGGQYPYTGASCIVALVSVFVASGAPTPTGKLVRALVPLLFLYLFYSASPDGASVLERLQNRMGLPHFLLVFGSSLLAITFTGKKRSKIESSKVEVPEVLAKPIPRPDEAFDRIVGQKHVIEPLREIADIARSGIRVGKRNAPHAVLLFLGPTGVGKTEAARALAEAVYGTTQALIRFDMGQFTDSSQASRFYGPPPGYVGSEEGGQLTRAVKRKPKSVVLLDEMEKADPQIWDAFLPVFDEGYIVDGSFNEKVDMTNTIIVLTSNLLAGEEGVSGLSAEDLKDRVQQTGVLRPELLGRINEILVFDPLNTSSIAEILRRRLDAALWSLSEQGIAVAVEESEIDVLVDQVKSAKFGVRQIDDVVRKHLRKKIAEVRPSEARLD
jgi:energy-coupling factor transporter ATP-binding protein EcfA2